MCRNAEIEAQIAHLRAELLHKDQENERVQLQLHQEKEERERAQRKVTVALMLAGMCNLRLQVQPVQRLINS